MYSHVWQLQTVRWVMSVQVEMESAALLLFETPEKHEQKNSPLRSILKRSVLPWCTSAEVEVKLFSDSERWPTPPPLFSTETRRSAAAARRQKAATAVLKERSYLPLPAKLMTVQLFQLAVSSVLCYHGNHSNHTEENNTEAEFSGISVLGIIHLVKSSDKTDQGVSNGATLFKVWLSNR